MTSAIFVNLKEGTLRPLELASLRLMNMIEVLSKWKIYMNINKYLTQRGGTYFINSDNEIIFSFKNKALLGFSETMDQPLKYLEDWI